jgi:preprotein translocase subunit SecA
MAEAGIPIIGPILNKLIGTRNDRFVKKYNQRTEAINALEPKISKLTDEELRGKVQEFRARHDKGEKTEDIMVEAFAVAREAMDRSVGLRNAFNPKFNFDPSRLDPAMRDLYRRIREESDALPPAPPTGEWMGSTQPIPGFRQVKIPVEMYEAIRALYPESRPPFRARPFDVQLIGGMVLCQGKIAEMKTGEGKTIVAPLACYMACIERLRVHVVTVNDYLVQRDRDWTSPYFHALGLTVGAIHPQHMQDEGEKRIMYRCDVVYGTTSEFGFDYLRDNMKRRVEEQVQRKREFAVVDEVDSILIDEARTPLIISGQAHEFTPRYDLADSLARHLVAKQVPWNEADELVQKCMMKIKGLEGDIRQTRDKARVPEMEAELKAAKLELPKLEAARDKHTQFYELKIERKQALLTHDGVTEAQRVASVGSFYVDDNIDLPHLVEQSLRAHTVYELDKDYVVMPVPDQMTGQQVPSVVIVDTSTGRPMIGRQWSDGLHQAIECKEKVQIKQETQTVASVTIQNFFKMYKRLSGMTGTADTEAQEFHDIYSLDVVAIPTNRRVVRRDFEDVVYLSAKDKYNAIVDETKNFHDLGRPVLVGTTSVERSEFLSKLLTQRASVKHEVLNAKPEKIAREAEVVENAGQLGSVMIATNMAGRGTDIKLGPITRETLLHHWQVRNICPGTVTVESTDEQLREGVYRKIAPRELNLQKTDIEKMSFEEVELKLLRHWANQYTWLSPKAIDGMNRDSLVSELDQVGRFALHRIRWFSSIEDMGGLHIIGTERHDSRRIDNQLRGRSGRQGDNGSSRFFVSFEDELMKRFSGEAHLKLMSRIGMKEGDAIEHPWVSKSIETAQRKVEEMYFQYRKNVLEYDEVMEYQRRAFYGTRQQVLEGRDVKGLIFSFINHTVDDACKEYLDPIYPYQCASDYAKAKLECHVAPERLRGKELHEIESTIIEEALYESRQAIDVTIGEYMPAEGSEVAVDFDRQGLMNWARSRFGVELTEADLRDGNATERRRVRDSLVEAAHDAVRATELNGLAAFLSPDYGARELSKWIQEKLAFPVEVEEIVRTNKAAADTGKTVTALVMSKVEERYRQREIEYPVDWVLQMTQAIMRQSPQEAAGQFLGWANGRFNLNWNEQIFRSSTPQKVREELIAANKKYVLENQLQKEIEEGLACKTDDDFDRWHQTKYQRPMPENMRFLTGKEREDAIRARIENMRRPELLNLERSILLETLDDQWKGHLYAMDQLRDTINFRAFSQNDPRIEYKREGSHLFNDMLETVRGRITEYIFKVRVNPGFGQPPVMGGPAGNLMAAPMPRPPMAPPMSSPTPRPTPPGTPSGTADGMY